MAIALKRVYEPASSGDGVRVLVDRLWPRGLSKEAAKIKLWLRDLAPSTELRKWYHANPEQWNLFKKRYLKELFEPDAAEAVEELYRLERGKRTITLLYGSRNEERNNATVLKELLEGSRKPPSSVGAAGSGGGRVRKTRKQ